MRDITIVLKGDYTDRDVKRAIRDLQTLQTQGSKTATSAGPTSKALADIGKSWKSLGAGFVAGFGAQAVIGQLKDVASTAMEDQASVTKLAVAMRNLGVGAQQSGVEDYIKKTMMATGVMDDQLRPAFARLLRSTDSVSTSQSAMNAALDISAATGKDLDTVANALGKAYDGNAASLGRLGLGIDKATLKSGDMNKIMSVITTKFGGQAAAAAGTYTGQMQRLSAAVDEAKESIGYGLLGALTDVQGALGGTDGSVDLIGDMGSSLGDLARGFGVAVAVMAKFANSASDSGKPLIDWGDAAKEAVRALPLVGQSLIWLADRGNEANAATAALNDEINKDIAVRQMYALNATAAGDADAYAATKAKELNAEIERMNRGLSHQQARSSVEAAIDAFAGADEHGTKTVKDKHGKTHTVKTTKQFMTDWKGSGFDLTTAAGRQGLDLASALIAAVQNEAKGEKATKAVKTYAYGRRSLIAQLEGIGVDEPDAHRYARTNLATPGSIKTQAAIMTNSNNKTTITVNAPGRSQAEINEIINRAYRLQMLGTAPHGAASAVDSTPTGRNSAAAYALGLEPAS